MCQGSGILLGCPTLNFSLCFFMGKEITMQKSSYRPGYGIVTSVPFGLIRVSPMATFITDVNFASLVIMAFESHQRHLESIGDKLSTESYSFLCKLDEWKGFVEAKDPGTSPIFVATVNPQFGELFYAAMECRQRELQQSNKRISASEYELMMTLFQYLVDQGLKEGKRSTYARSVAEADGGDDDAEWGEDD